MSPYGQRVQSRQTEAAHTRFSSRRIDVDRDARTERFIHAGGGEMMLRRWQISSRAIN
jgi:hypothetical protein